MCRNGIKRIDINKINLADYENKDYDMQITQVFNAIGVSAAYTGYAQLRTAVRVCAVNKDLQYQLVKGVYAIVALIYETNAHAVERNIKTFIATMWDTCERCMIRKYINCVELGCNLPPTNSHVIATMSDNLRMGAYADML